MNPAKGITLSSLPGNRTVCLHLFLRLKPHSVCCLNPLGCACKRQRALVPPPAVTRTMPSSDQRNEINVQQQCLPALCRATQWLYITRLWKNIGHIGQLYFEIEHGIPNAKSGPPGLKIKFFTNVNVAQKVSR